jgi:alanine racemase
MGYADGYLGSNPEAGACLLVRGCKVPVVGRVCMDQLMLDVTDIEGVQRGDTVTVFGTDGDAVIPVGELAKNNHTINYELICAVGPRVPRFFFKNGRLVWVDDPVAEDYDEYIE